MGACDLNVLRLLRYTSRGPGMASSQIWRRSSLGRSLNFVNVCLREGFVAVFVARLRKLSSAGRDERGRCASMSMAVACRWK